MNQDKIFSFLRQLLSFAGAWLIGKQLFGSTVDNSTLEMLIGVVLSIAGLVWGVVDKTANIEMWQSVARHVITSVGGMFVASGKLSAMALEQILGITLFVITLLQGWMSRKKVEQIKQGAVSVHTLKGATK